MRLLLALLLMLWAGSADAQVNERLQRELRGIKGDDDRVAVPPLDYPWTALGRLNTSTGGHCTAMMVAPRLVLTAAHCLWNGRTRQVWPASGLTFVAGWDRGSYIRASKVAKVHPAPHWRADGGGKSAHADWGFVELVEPLGEEVGWVGLGKPSQPGTAVTVAGYGKDKAQLPMAHLGCRLSSRLAEGVFLHDCDAVQGDSGAPLLAWQGGEFRIVGVNVAVIVTMGDIGVAVDVTNFQAEAARLGAASSGRPGRLSKPMDPELGKRMGGK